MLKWGFDELKLQSIVACASVRNAASERVMQKLGMKLISNGAADGITIRGYEIGREAF